MFLNAESIKHLNCFFVRCKMLPRKAITIHLYFLSRVPRQSLLDAIKRCKGLFRGTIQHSALVLPFPGTVEEILSSLLPRRDPLCLFCRMQGPETKREENVNFCATTSYCATNGKTEKNEGRRGGGRKERAKTQFLSFTGSRGTNKRDRHIRIWYYFHPRLLLTGSNETNPFILQHSVFISPRCSPIHPLWCSR